MTGPALLAFQVYGRPAPQGSKRALGPGRMVEMSRHVKPWREDVRAAALSYLPAGWVPLDEPLVVRMTFTLAKPASAPKKRQTWPMRTPDLSKLVRATEDAMTTAGVWRDDARVVDLRAVKAYPDEGYDALSRPGAVIRVWVLEDFRSPSEQGKAAGAAELGGAA